MNPLRVGKASGQTTVEYVMILLISVALVGIISRTFLTTRIKRFADSINQKMADDFRRRAKSSWL